MNHIVYKTINEINDKFYVGIHSTKNINDHYLGSGVAILNAVDKYGVENFTKEILAVLPDRETALDIEGYVVDEKMINRDDCYNLILGGVKGVGSGKNHPNFHIKGEDHPSFGMEYDEEHRKKISKALKEYYSNYEHPLKGFTHSEESRKKMSESLSGQKHCEERKKRKSERFSGKGNPFYGKKHTKETRKKLKEAHKSRTSYSGKTVVHLESGKEFESIAAASRHFDMNVGNLGAHCRGNRHNIKFKFKKDLEDV